MSLKLELAVTFDVGEHFDKATHFLEGLVPFLACEVKLSAVSQFYQAPCFPKVRAIATVIAEEDPGQNVTALELSAKAFFEPATKWFLRKFNVAFKAARLFCPVRIQWLKPTNALVLVSESFSFPG